MTKPMLAKSYEKDGHKIQYPAFIQPKLDGFRCVAVKHEGHVTLYLRSGDVIDTVPHINRALNALMTNGDVLDGELYKHGIPFDQLSGDLRAQDGRNTSYVEYHIYDHPIVLNDRDYKQHERFIQLRQYRDNNMLIAPLAYVDTWAVYNEERMLAGLEYYLAKGYEGVMVRDMHGLYGFGKRSDSLQKVKKFYEEEYRIIDIIEGKGKLKGHVGSFVCDLGNGKTVKAKMGGDQAELKRMFENPDTCIGHMLTVKFQEKTKNGIPRFPVGKALRWDTATE